MDMQTGREIASEASRQAGKLAGREGSRQAGRWSGGKNSRNSRHNKGCGRVGRNWRTQEIAVVYYKATESSTLLISSPRSLFVCNIYAPR